MYTVNVNKLQKERMYTMNSKRFLQKTFLSILIVTAILLGSFSACLTVYAVEANGDVLAELGAADTGLTVEKLVLSEDDVPEVIDFAEAQEKGHVLRLRSKESDDNTVVFLNDDNTETMYLFAEPVKYTDEHGNIKDKSTALTLSDGAYTMAQNDVKVRFARDISKGVTVNKGGVNITMTPVSTTVNSRKLNADSNAELVSVNENKITYSNVFQSAELVYTTLYSGFKEDIVLESYDGINEFAFIVNTNGLYPVKQENGAVYFFEPNTDELVAKMMQVVCYDSAYNFAEGDVRIAEVKANQIYGFTVVADSAFLTDEDTVYPVYVDPTITLNTESTIEDAVVYSGKPTRNYGDYSYLNVGYVDDTYKLGYMMIRFPTLANHSTFASLANSDINSATLTIYTASGGSGTEVLRLFTAASEWTESTVTYSTVPNTPPPVQFGQMTAPSGGGAPTKVVLTDTVKLWAQGATYTTPSKGIYILNGNSTDATQCRDFLSVEYALSSDSRSGYMPKLVIDYGDYSSHLELQEQSMWCWAASARMASSYYMDSNISPASAAVYIMNTEITSNPTAEQIAKANKGANAEKTANALEYILNGEYEVFYAEKRIYSLDALRTLLDNGTPVIALRSYVVASGQITTGHATVIVDYYYDNGWKLVILDPSPNNPNNIYTEDYYTYCDSRGIGGSGYVWQDVILVAESVYNTTTPAPTVAPIN